MQTQSEQPEIKPTLFRCECPGCRELAEVKRDRRGQIYMTCAFCVGRIFGPHMVLGYVDKIGGDLVCEPASMSRYELIELLRRYRR